MVKYFTTSVTSKSNILGTYRQTLIYRRVLGDVIWEKKFPLPKKEGSILAIDLESRSNLVVAASYDGRIWAMAADSGAPLWETDVSVDVTSIQIIPALRIVAVGDQINCRFLSQFTGKEVDSAINGSKWHFRTATGCLFNFGMEELYFAQNLNGAFVHLQDAPDLPREVMETRSFFYIQFWRNDSHLYCFSKSNGTIEKGYETSAISACISNEDLHSCRFLTTSQEANRRQLAEISSADNISVIASPQLPRGIWQFCGNGELLVSAHGTVFDVSKNQVVQESWTK